MESRKYQLQKQIIEALKANNNDLYITTALKGLKEIDKKKYNLSGSLFKVRTNSKGMTSKSFNVIYG